MHGTNFSKLQNIFHAFQMRSMQKEHIDKHTCTYELPCIYICTCNSCCCLCAAPSADSLLHPQSVRQLWEQIANQILQQIVYPRQTQRYQTQCHKLDWARLWVTFKLIYFCNISERIDNCKHWNSDQMQLLVKFYQLFFSCDFSSEQKLIKSLANIIFSLYPYG